MKPRSADAEAAERKRQLEAELVDNAWLTCPADSSILFDLPYDQRLNAAGISDQDLVFVLACQIAQSQAARDLHSGIGQMEPHAIHECSHTVLPGNGGLVGGIGCREIC